MQRNWPEAEAAWRRLRVEVPSDASVCLAWADAALLSGKVDDVEAYLRDGANLPSIRRLLRARVQFANHDNEAARRSLEIVIKETPLLPVRLMLAKVYEETGDKRRAIATLEQAERADPRSAEVRESLVRLRRHSSK